MHAYASEDPVFRAMNKRMIRETNGASKDLCVSCHAPVALRLGLTTDGQNLSDLPTAVQGVTCYFCHTVDSVGETHNNNSLHLANDDTLRGGITNPVKSMPHKGKYSTLHDRENRAQTLAGVFNSALSLLILGGVIALDTWRTARIPGEAITGELSKAESPRD